MDKFVEVYKGTPPDVCVCDQALRILPNVDWAIFFMTGGDTEPRRENYIAMCRSTDGGDTWGKKETVLKFEDKACTLSEAYVHGSEIRIMVSTHSGNFGDWENFVLTSKDNAATWLPPVPFEAMPRRAFLRNLYISTWGTWYLPYQTYNTDAVDDLAVSPLEDGSHSEAYNGVLMSDDEGRTWTLSDPTGPTAGWAENNVVELSDGTMVMLIRADGTGTLKRSMSSDKGMTWTETMSVEIANPSSKFRLHRLHDGRIVLVHNPNILHGVRNPLGVWMTDDDMKHWRFKRVICDNEGQLQYPDGFVDEESSHVHIAFDHNRNTLVYLSTTLPDVMRLKFK